MKNGGKYYLDMTQENYYANIYEKAGSWFGEGAERLGLSGSVTKATLKNLFRGFSPNGRAPLVQNAGDKNRQCGWDLTFSAPKSVSVLWAAASPALRLEIEQIHGDAVKDALSELQRVAGVTRRGKGGHIKEKADLVLAALSGRNKQRAAVRSEGDRMNH